MKRIFPYLRFVGWAFILTTACHELDERTTNYLPLKVGQKYQYEYSEYYWYVGENSITHGECTWDFVSASVGNPVVYQVKQTLNGLYIHEYYDYSSGTFLTKTDSTQINNQISILTFEAPKDGEITFTFILPYRGNTSVSFNRFILSDKIDTCMTIHFTNQVCLKKDVGISSFGAIGYGNHSGSVFYSLTKGPYY